MSVKLADAHALTNVPVAVRILLLAMPSERVFGTQTAPAVIEIGELVVPDTNIVSLININQLYPVGTFLTALRYPSTKLIICPFFVSIGVKG